MGSRCNHSIYKKPRRRHRGGRGRNKPEGEAKSAENVPQPRKSGDKPREEKKPAGKNSGKKPNAQNKAVVKPVKVEPKAEESGEQPHRSNRRRHYRKPRPKQGGES